MAEQFVTRDDLRQFKEDLLGEIKSLLRSKNPNLSQKEWLKAFEVRKLLGISNGTLQNMRINGTIAFTRIGGLTFYRYEDIVKLMEENKYQNPLLKGLRK